MGREKGKGWNRAGAGFISRGRERVRLKETHSRKKKEKGEEQGEKQVKDDGHRGEAERGEEVDREGGEMAVSWRGRAGGPPRPGGEVTSPWASAAAMA